MFQAHCVAVETDEDGIVPDDAERKMKEYHPKMVYVIPTFHNPTGKTLTRERRQRLAELGSQYDVLILEDDPYRDLRYSGEELPPIKVFDKTGHTVLANSFSKIFSPGSRLGYVVAAPPIMERLLSYVGPGSGTVRRVLQAGLLRRALEEDSGDLPGAARRHDRQHRHLPAEGDEARLP